MRPCKSRFEIASSNQVYCDSQTDPKAVRRSASLIIVDRLSAIKIETVSLYSQVQAARLPMRRRASTDKDTAWKSSQKMSLICDCVSRTPALLQL